MNKNTPLKSNLRAILCTCLVLTIVVMTAGSQGAVVEARQGSSPIKYYALLLGSGAWKSERDSKIENIVEEDVKAMHSTLVNSGKGWSTERIKTLTNDQISVEAIDQAISELGRNMHADDVFLFFYVGHGGVAGLDLFPNDVSNEFSQFYRASHLASELDASMPQGVKTIILLNACYSGVFPYVFEQKHRPNTVVISSSSITEPTPIFQFGSIDFLHRSMATYHYINALEGSTDVDVNGDGIVSTQELYTYIQAHPIFVIAREGIKPVVGVVAHPQVYVSDPNNPIPVMVRNEQYRASPAVRMLQPDSDITVAAGTKVQIKWDIESSDRNTTISLARDADDTPAPWANESNHTWLAVAAPVGADVSNNVYEWDTTGVESGTYTLWAMVYDGVHQQRFDRARGRITIQAQPVATKPPLPDAVVKNKDGVRVREQTGVGSKSLALVPQGTELHVIGRSANNSWLKVVTPDGITGWSATYLLTVNIDLSTVPVIDVDYIGRPEPSPTIPPRSEPGSEGGNSGNGWVPIYYVKGSITPSDGTITILSLERDGTEIDCARLRTQWSFYFSQGAEPSSWVIDGVSYWELSAGSQRWNPSSGQFEADWRVIRRSDYMSTCGN